MILKVVLSIRSLVISEGVICLLELLPSHDLSPTCEDGTGEDAKILLKGSLHSCYSKKKKEQISRYLKPYFFHTSAKLNQKLDHSIMAFCACEL